MLQSWLERENGVSEQGGKAWCVRERVSFGVGEDRDNDSAGENRKRAVRVQRNRAGFAQIIENKKMKEG